MSALAILRDTLADALAPPPTWRVSEWAGERRHLSQEASAEHGLWRNARAPHLVAPMDALSPYDPAERVVCKFASQSGKTEIALNLIGYVIDMDPGPVLAIQPNVSPMGEAFSKDRVNTMLRDSPSLAAKIGDLKARTSAQTITHKTFPGGHLTIAGANSPAGLASRPIRYLIADELDRWEATKEGDPLLLARKRQQTYRARRRSKELIVSSPTYDDIGISAEYLACTQTWEWHLACLHCSATQMPTLAHFACDDKDPATVRYACSHCGSEHSVGDEAAVKATGRWINTKDDGRREVGFWFNQWSSPFARWDDTLGEWLAAQGDPAKMQVVTNTAFATGWDGDGEKVEPHALSSRAEVYTHEAPDGVAIITLGADVQNDRIEVEVVGWAANRESWSLGYHVLPGEPTSEDVWQDLLDLYHTPYQHASGGILSPVTLCVDAGAFTQHVYEFVKRTRQRGIVPVKGAAGMTRDQIDMDVRARHKRLARRLRDGKPPEILGVDSIKRTIFSYLSASPGKAGYCHFPVGRSDEYYAQLTGERLVPVTVRGRRPERRWKPVHPNVEALDCRVYAYAGLLLYGVDRVRPPQLDGSTVREERRVNLPRKVGNRRSRW